MTISSSESEKELETISSCASLDPDLQLSRILKCKLCNHQFQNPIILPCFNSVCAHHTTESSKKLFECGLCSNTHFIPRDGFKANKEINDMIAIFKNIAQFNTNKLCENSHFQNFDLKQKMKLENKKLNETIEKCDKFVNESHTYVNGKFDELVHEIDLKKKKLIDSIENHHKLINDSLERYRKLCNQEADLKSVNFKQIIQASKDKCEKWRRDSIKNEFQFSRYWKGIISNETFETNKLNHYLDKYKDDLVLNSEFKFNEFLTGLKWGELVKRNLLRKNNDKSKIKTLRMVMGNFKEFINEYGYTESADYVVIGRVAWRIQIDIERSDSYDLHLGFFVRIDTDFPNMIELNPIYAEVTLRLLPIDNSVNYTSLSETFKQLFDKTDVGHGYKSFISLKQLMDPNYGVYDSKRDCVTFEASIKMISNNDGDGKDDDDDDDKFQSDSESFSSSLSFCNF